MKWEGSGLVLNNILKCFFGLPKPFCRAHFVAKSVLLEPGTHFVANKHELSWSLEPHSLVKSGHFLVVYLATQELIL